MDFDYSPEQRELFNQITRFARNELSPGAAERDKGQVFSRELWKKSAEMGLLGLPVPVEYGGTGLDAVSTVIALEALGYGCADQGLVFSICAHVLACAVPIVQYGSDAQKENYLPGMCDGSIIAVNSMTEAESGSDAFNMLTKAVPNDTGYVLNGSKVFGSNAPVADLSIVYASTDNTKGFMGGVTSFVVNTDRPGCSRSKGFEKMGLKTCPVGEVAFDDVQVTDADMLGEFGAGGPIFNRSMQWERICLVAAHCGHMQRLIETCIAYAKTRKSFGKSLGEYQAITHKIADMKVRLEAARLMTYRAAFKLDKTSHVDQDAAMTKLFVSEALVHTAQDAMQIHGGYGYMTEYEIERSLRDAMAATIYSGTSEMQRNIIASWLGLKGEN